MNLNRKSKIENRKSPRGFTLIELLLVLVILGVLAAIVVPKFTGRSEEARITAAKTQISNLRLAIGVFEHDYGRFPQSLQELVNPPVDPSGKQHDSYLEGGLPDDPWGRPYVYRPGANGASSYQLFSSGADGQPDTGDDIDVLKK